MKADLLVQAFDRLVRRRPDAPIVLSQSRSCSAETLDATARIVLARLRRAAIEPGRVVGLRAPNGPGFLAALLALRRAGLAALLIDHRAPAPERRSIARHLGAVSILHCRTAWPTRSEDWTLEPGSSSRPTPVEAAADVIKLSSGSTGRPRGIATPVESLLADDEALIATMGIVPTDRLLAGVPFSHSYGLSSLVIPALVRGLPLLVPDAEGPFSQLDVARSARATVLPSTPAYLDALLRVSRLQRLPESLRLVVSAGAPLPPQTARRFRETFRLPIHAFYGASECGGICYDREGSAAERGMVGCPVEGVSIAIHDVPGAKGEPYGRVLVRSPAVARGYLPHDNSRLGDGRFLTDDLAVRRDGELALVGRIAEIINVKGKKVNPREVEAVLARIANVEEVVVLGLPASGGRGQIVRAVIACRPRALTTEGVLTWCHDRLTDHKIPRSIVLLDRIPRTERGKVDKPALARLDPTSTTPDRARA